MPTSHNVLNQLTIILLTELGNLLGRLIPGLSGSRTESSTAAATSPDPPTRTPTGRRNSSIERDRQVKQAADQAKMDAHVQATIRKNRRLGGYRASSSSSTSNPSHQKENEDDTAVHIWGDEARKLERNAGAPSTSSSEDGGGRGRAAGPSSDSNDTGTSDASRGHPTLRRVGRLPTVIARHDYQGLDDSTEGDDDDDDDDGFHAVPADPDCDVVDDFQSSLQYFSSSSSSSSEGEEEKDDYDGEKPKRKGKSRVKQVVRY